MNPLQRSRRSFIKATLTAGVAPMFLPPHAWAADTKPNDRLGVGFIGMGVKMTGDLVEWLSRGDLQVVAVCDVDTTRRENAKRTAEGHYAKQAGAGYKGCGAYNDFRALLARKDVDVVCITTPDHWHALIGIAAAKAGKDIYCEKPLTNTIHEAWALEKAIRDNSRVFQTGSQQRSDRNFRVACELVRNRVIGKVSRVEVAVGGPSIACDLPEEAMEPGLDWDRWLGPAPMRGYSSVLSPRGVHRHFPDWRKYWEYGGGMITDWGAHHFDIAQWALGEDGRGPLEILPAAGQNPQHGVTLKYTEDVEVRHVSGNGITFYGKDGMILVGRGRLLMKLGDREFDRQYDTVEKEFLASAKVKLQVSPGHVQDFVDCVRSRRRPIADVGIGACTVTTCHLVNLAYRYGQKIQWDPAKHEFAGGTGKPAWLTRDYRGEWKV